jgi:hypothetical protein
VRWLLPGGLSRSGGERIQMRQDRGVQWQQFRRWRYLWLAIRWSRALRSVWLRSGNHRNELHIGLLRLLGFAAASAIGATPPSTRRRARRWLSCGGRRGGHLGGDLRRGRFLNDGLLHGRGRFSGDHGWLLCRVLLAL